MTHPFIEDSLKYRQAQARVLHEAEVFEAKDGKDPASLLEEVRKMNEAKIIYLFEKDKAMAETHGRIEK